jgi:hypothetical protein
MRLESHCTLTKTRSSIERTVVSKNWIKQLHTLLALHFNHCLTTEYSETIAHFNSNFDTDNQIYSTKQLSKCTVSQTQIKVHGYINNSDVDPTDWHIYIIWRHMLSHEGVRTMKV